MGATVYAIVLNKDSLLSVYGSICMAVAYKHWQSIQKLPLFIEDSFIQHIAAVRRVDSNQR